MDEGIDPMMDETVRSAVSSIATPSATDFLNTVRPSTHVREVDALLNWAPIAGAFVFIRVKIFYVKNSRVCFPEPSR